MTQRARSRTAGALGNPAYRRLLASTLWLSLSGTRRHRLAEVVELLRLAQILSSGGK